MWWLVKRDVLQWKHFRATVADELGGLARTGRFVKWQEIEKSVLSGNRATGQPGTRATEEPGNRATGKPGNQAIGKPGDWQLAAGQSGKNGGTRWPQPASVSDWLAGPNISIMYNDFFENVQVNIIMLQLYKIDNSVTNLWRHILKGGWGGCIAHEVTQ